MEKLHFSVIIKAPKEKVWDIMFGKDSYPKWAASFKVGSHYLGNWSPGSRMLFLAPGETAESGMVSQVVQNRPYELISLEHLGVVRNGIQDTSSDAVMRWSGAREEYRFRETDSGTEVLVDTDTTDEYRKMFQTVWPKALKKLKELAEKERPVAVARKRGKTKISASSRRRKQ